MPLLSIIITFTLSFLAFTVTRKKTLIPLFILATYIPMGQYISIAGLNFTPLRIIILIYFVRFFVKHEYSSIKLNILDKAIISWCFVTVAIGLLRNFNSSMFILKMGFLYNVLGLYFIFRFAIKGFNDLLTIFKLLPIIIFPLAVFMTYEYLTGNNIFSYVGGAGHPWIRSGRFRCQGPFRHAILAGTFGATLIPYMWFLYKNSIVKINVAIIGMISAVVITFTSSSSGPILTLVFSFLALLLWRFRTKFRFVRWMLLGLFISLILFMKAPVWYIFARLGNIMGGTGWHRSYLIDTTIRHFNEWWLLGTDYTSHWMPYALPDYPNQMDITNEFILQAVHGGILSLFLFVVIIIISFNYIGKGLDIASLTHPQKHLLWVLGSTLGAHVTAFLSVTYFDNIIVMYYFLLAAISISYEHHFYTTLSSN